MVPAGTNPTKPNGWSRAPIAGGRRRREADGVTVQESPARSVVCGVDQSEDARVALRVAAKFADALGLRLVVAHVQQPHATPAMRVFGPATPMIAPSPGEDLGVALGALQELLGAESVDEAELRVEAGFPAEAIADLADRENAELVVVGSRGQGAFKAAFLGSVSNELIGIARCPVLVVPRGVVA